jgi:hypothetical protein
LEFKIIIIAMEIEKLKGNGKLILPEQQDIEERRISKPQLR